MDLLLLVVILVASILYFLIFGHLNPKRNEVKRINNVLVKRPPEVAGSWPIIGHLHLLSGSQLPQQVLGSMADKFGPIFTIKLGVHRVLVVCSAEMAKECLTTNDRAFASRPKAMASELMGYNYASVGLAPHGPYWRMIRKLIVTELTSQHRLKMIARIKVSEVKSSMMDIYRTWETAEGSSKRAIVDMNEWSEKLIVNMVVKMLFGNHFSRGEQSGEKFLKTIRRIGELYGEFVPSDFIPWIRWLDLGGYGTEMKKIALQMDAAINKWLEDHKKNMNNQSSTPQVDESKDQENFMAALLRRVEQAPKEELYGFNANDVVKSTCLVLFAGGTDTTDATLTWALALLVNNPMVLKKAQQEIENHVGKDRKVEQSDMSKLVYLQAIIKEVMRLYPVVPLSVPHESTEDCIVNGYMVPKGTRLLINIWKINHDPQIWTNPFEFQPERFLTSKKEVDVKGRHFELIPFGSGRRMCLGMSFALESLHLILASMIHAFAFQNPSNEKINMTENNGIVNHKAGSLELLVAPRLPPHVYGLLD
ncbi:hypothetical protein E3N88_16569 [Mikania micrantha]|uniref:Cytochrome P450 n=1 Tax=Mikania micrantha TaxID=192012 RepID=A0A5N6NYT4_9ASTR|nr:hypothetical protein E3N88_16569 [Mikania micrantha]